jgi:hypothetical protein
LEEKEWQGRGGGKIFAAGGEREGVLRLQGFDGYGRHFGSSRLSGQNPWQRQRSEVFASEGGIHGRLYFQLDG